jgi:hypothetical protein
LANIPERWYKRKMDLLTINPTYHITQKPTWIHRLQLYASAYISQRGFPVVDAILDMWQMEGSCSSLSTTFPNHTNGLCNFSKPDGVPNFLQSPGTSQVIHQAQLDST